MLREAFERLLKALTGATASKLSRNAAQKTIDAINNRDAALEAFTDFYPDIPYGDNIDGRRPLEYRYFWGGKTRKFPSPKAEAYFFAVVLPSGAVPYVRTGKLRDATTATIERADADGFVVRLSTDIRRAPYARYVIGDRQFYYHGITGWPTLAASAEKAMSDPVVRSALAQPYLDTLAGYFGRRTQ